MEKTTAKLTPLCSFYETVLHGYSMMVDEEGRLVEVDKTTDTWSKSPAIVGGKRLILPLPSLVKENTWEHELAFHPLYETIMGGEPEVVTYLRRRYLRLLNKSLVVYMLAACNRAAAPESHKKLDPKQGEVLHPLRECDSNMVAQVEKLFRKINLSKANEKLVHIYLKKGAVIDGEKCNRGAMVSFPLYEQLKGDTDPLGVKVTKKLRTALIDLHEYIFPELKTDGAESYSRPSGAVVTAPYFDAFLQVTLELSNIHNDVWSKYAGKSKKSVETILMEVPDVSSLLDKKWLAKAMATVPVLPNGDNAHDEDDSLANARSVTLQEDPNYEADVKIAPKKEVPSAAKQEVSTGRKAPPIVPPRIDERIEVPDRPREREGYRDPNKIYLPPPRTRGYDIKEALEDPRPFDRRDDRRGPKDHRDDRRDPRYDDGRYDDRYDDRYDRRDRYDDRYDRRDGRYDDYYDRRDSYRDDRRAPRHPRDAYGDRRESYSNASRYAPRHPRDRR